MTEDMRERFEKWATDYRNGFLNKNGRNQKGIAREAWQAALSSAGTSGTPSAPDRAEELAREIAKLAENPLLRPKNVGLVEAVAALLRREMGRWNRQESCSECDGDGCAACCVGCRRLQAELAEAPPREGG